MNILALSPRQWKPKHEWLLLGIRNLFAKAVTTSCNWILADQNPDLCKVDALGYTQKHIDQSNSFRHQSLISFSTTVIAGTAHWTGSLCEDFYGLLSKSNLPLFALGLEPPEFMTPLSDLERRCLSKHNALVVVQENSTQQYLEKYDIPSTVLPSPILFSTKKTPTKVSSARVGLVLEEKNRLTHKVLQELKKGLNQSEESINFQLTCLDIDSFMQYSTMYPQKVFYSYDSFDYLKHFEALDIVVTTDPDAAILANAVGVRALYISNGTDSPLNLNAYPYIKKLSLSEIKSEIQADVPVQRTQILDWKQQIEDQWVEILKNHLPIALNQ